MKLVFPFYCFQQFFHFNTLKCCFLGVFLIVMNTVNAQLPVIYTLQSDNFNDGAQLEWIYENTRIGLDTDWQITENGGDNLLGNGMALLDDDAATILVTGNASMTSPVLDLTNPSIGSNDAIALYFIYNYRHLEGSSFKVEIKTGEGENDWLSVMELTADDCGAWEDCTDSYNAFVYHIEPQYWTPFFQVRFTYDDGGGWAYYAAFDNYFISHHDIPECPLTQQILEYQIVESCVDNIGTYRYDFIVDGLHSGQVMYVTLSLEGDRNESSTQEMFLLNNGVTYSSMEISECSVSSFVANCYKSCSECCPCSYTSPQYPVPLHEAPCCAATNDECIDAIEMGNTADYTFTDRYKTSATYSSSEPNFCTNDEVAPRDLWFKSLVPIGGEIDYSYTITIPEPKPYIPIVYVEAYEGECGSLTSLGSCTDTGGTLTNLTSEYVYFRVWSDSQTLPFDITFDIDGLGCIPPAFSYTITPDCDNQTVQVDLTIDQLEEGVKADIIIEGVRLVTDVEQGDNFIFAVGYDECEPKIEIKVEAQNASLCTKTVIEDIVCVADNPNDECIVAQQINHREECDVVISESLCNATVSDGFSTPDVWFQFIAKQSNPNISIFSDFTSVIEVYSGDCGSLMYLGNQPAEWNLEKGNTYYIRVSNASGEALSGEAADFTICLHGPIPDNDRCDNATFLGDITQSGGEIEITSFAATNADASNNPDCDEDFTPNQGVWFYLQGFPGEVRMVTVTAPEEVALYAYTGFSCDDIGCINQAQGLGTNEMRFIADNSGPTAKSAAFNYYIYVAEEVGMDFKMTFIIESRSNFPLSLEWIDFQVTAQEKSNVLNWQTTTEKDIQSFLIERSTNGEDQWKKIGEVSAKGNSMTTQSYQFKDPKPTPISYYRLRTMENNGSSSTSMIRVVHSDENSTFQVYPNPVNDYLQLHWEGDNNTHVQVQLLNLTGQVIYTESRKVTRGLQEKKIHMDDLPRGVYFFSVFNGKNRQIQRVVKH